MQRRKIITSRANVFKHIMSTFKYLTNWVWLILSHTD